MRNAFSIAAGASSGSTSRDANTMSTKMLMLISPSVSVTGSISTKNRLTVGSRQSKTGRSLPSRPRSHGTGRRSCTAAATSVAIAYTISWVDSLSTSGTKTRSPPMMTRFQATGASAGTVNWS